MLADQFTDFMIIVLVAAAVISGFIGEVIDTVAIVVIVLMNVTIGFIQEYRAEQAMAALKKLAAATARVVREGATSDLPAAELVPGDIVLLEAGNVVPADLRLAESVVLKTEEAALTGESVPVEKRPGRSRAPTSRSATAATWPTRARRSPTAAAAESSSAPACRPSSARSPRCCRSRAR